MGHAEETFECVWCKAGGCDPEEYTRPMSEAIDVGGGDMICQECRDAAIEEKLADKYHEENPRAEAEW